MINTTAKPFLKWAGGKGQLLNQFEAHFPKELKDGQLTRYVEPFVGGGAVFFELNKHYSFKEVILNDFNIELILTYRIIRDNVDALIAELASLEDKFLKKKLNKREEMFYKIRDKFNKERRTLNYRRASKRCISHASKMIFLNKTCFNGLYRVNQKGDFNVPFGDYKKPTICSEANLRHASSALQGVILLHGDFGQLTPHIDNNTFVYMDPPYRPLSSTSSFNSYQMSPFNNESQIRLAQWYKQLHHEKGAFLMLSNSDPANTDPSDNFFHDLYQGFTIKRVQALRSINVKGNDRGAIYELLITNAAQLTHK